MDTSATRDRPTPGARTMRRTRFIEHKGKRILMLDYTELGSDDETLAAEIAETKRIIAREQPGTVLTLTDVRGSRITPNNVRTMGDLVRHNAPYVKWSAVVVGLTGVYLTAFRAIQVVSRRRNLQSFSSIDEAKDWLIRQP